MVPTTSTSSVPSVGSASITGSNGAAGAAHRDVGVAQLGGDVGEPHGLLLLPAEGLDDQRAVEALVGDRRDVGPELLGIGDARRHPALEDTVDRRPGPGRQRAR